ncbi:hypothetical protein BC351_05225 [Paenibacillus ferrarius]|uniref:Uncharacterized protein n=1 Tax=Paenibacillus ferrarius TaxID=1469647 RepID=A0A1V4HFB4_9BACL|nr:hypothetical protein BC351_05225 [Paenibacillus ferrarius]
MITVSLAARVIFHIDHISFNLKVKAFKHNAERSNAVDWITWFFLRKEAFYLLKKKALKL